MANHIKLFSWNLNGIRAVIKKEEFYSFIEKYDPEIVCFQETKAKQNQVDLELPNYHSFWNEADKAGYSGTLILTKEKPISVTRGLEDFMEDNEGRVLTAEYKDFFLVNVYTPNSKRELSRLPYRQTWDEQFCAYLKSLEKLKPVIMCGDLNVSHQEIDLANPKTNRKNAGFTDEERSGFDRFLENGFLDTFRLFEQGPGHYTWWSFRNQARERNIGWRLDYFLTSESLRPRIREASIHPDVFGSDHCPVSIALEL